MHGQPMHSERKADARRHIQEGSPRAEVGQGQRWEKELQAAKKELAKFHETARKITKKYLDKRDESGHRRRVQAEPVLVQHPGAQGILYAKPPTVDVSNSFKDTRRRRVTRRGQHP